MRQFMINALRNHKAGKEDRSGWSSGDGGEVLGSNRAIRKDYCFMNNKEAIVTEAEGLEVT